VLGAFRRRKYAEAIASARRAMEIDPNFHLIWLVMGSLNWAQACRGSGE